METINLVKKLSTKEQKELEAITSRISKIDMEKAVLLKQIRENTVYAVQHINDKISKIVGKYYKTPNEDVVYNVLSGEVLLGSAMRGAVRNKYKVTLSVTKFDKTGNSYASTYELTSPELPKDVDKWLTLGNVEMSQADAKKYVTTALIAEKKALQEKIAAINKQLK